MEMQLGVEYPTQVMNERRASTSSVVAFVATAVSVGTFGREAAGAVFQLPSGSHATAAPQVAPGSSAPAPAAAAKLSSAEVGVACFSAVVATGAVSRLAGGRRRVSQWLRPGRVSTARGANPDVIDVEASVGEGQADKKIYAGYEVPDDAHKVSVPRILLEGTEEVTLEGERPKGKSDDPDKMYWWKMAQDKRSIDVIVPVDDNVGKNDVIFRLGEECEDVRRGPTLEVGYRYRDEAGKTREKLIIDGRILNAIRREDSVWTLEEMAGVKVCIVTLTRPSMMRKRHDPIIHTAYEEERIEPQTWDALLVEERVKPKITHSVYLDISLDGEPAGRLAFGLFGNMVPKTVRNFVGLCTGTYEKEDGSTMESAFTYKGMSFDKVMPEYILAAGNPGLDNFPAKLTPEELHQYREQFQDLKSAPQKVGSIEAGWSLRWGADLGNPVVVVDGEESKMADGTPCDGNSDEQFAIITEKLRELDEKGEGASFFFFRPEFEKGVGADGTTFPAENFDVPHGGRGMLSMDRQEEQDQQGSCFFVTLREFPEMDKRWVTFGQIIAGEDLVDRIERDYDKKPKKVVIEDCGLLQDA